MALFHLCKRMIVVAQKKRASYLWLYAICLAFLLQARNISRF
jgi:hypothetical protein